MAQPTKPVDGEENPYYYSTMRHQFESEENHVLAFAPQWSYGSKSMG